MPLCGACPQPLAGDAGALREGPELRPGNRRQHRGRASKGGEATVDPGDDILTLGELDAGFLAALTINGDGGADAVTITRSLTLPGRDVEINAEAITVDAGVSVSTRATAGSSGDIRLTAASTKSLLSPLLPTPATVAIGAGAALLSDGGANSGQISLVATSERLDVDFPQIMAHVEGQDDVRRETSSRPVPRQTSHIDREEAPQRPAPAPAQPAVDRFVQPDGSVAPLIDIERELIAFAIKVYNGRMAAVARALVIGRSTLYRKLRAYGLGEETDDAA